jgi:RNA polymerase sigma-70 factor (ECF subfamily)
VNRDDETEPAQRDIEAVFERYGARCYSLAHRIVRDRDLAQDVVQDVFEALHRHPDRFDATRSTLSTWLMAVTHNKAVDAVRKTHHRTRLNVSDAALVKLRDGGANPEETACSNEEQTRIRQALRQLPATQRTPIVLTYFEGLTQKQTAELLQIPIGTVKSRTATGMHTLRSSLGYR